MSGTMRHRVRPWRDTDFNAATRHAIDDVVHVIGCVFAWTNGISIILQADDNAQRHRGMCDSHMRRRASRLE